MRAASPAALGLPASMARATASAVRRVREAMVVRCGAPPNLQVMRELTGEDRHRAHASVEDNSLVAAG